MNCVQVCYLETITSDNKAFNEIAEDGVCEVCGTSTKVRDGISLVTNEPFKTCFHCSSLQLTPLSKIVNSIRNSESLTECFCYESMRNLASQRKFIKIADSAKEQFDENSLRLEKYRKLGLLSGGCIE